jgi:transcriptional regulator with XRE-family HTH domain
VQQLRGAAQLSLAELARRSGVARATLTQVEAGDGNPTLDTLYALADALGRPLSDLISPPSAAPTRVVRAGEGPAVRGAVVAGHLLDRLRLPQHVLEVFSLRLAPGERQRRDGHPTGTHEHLVLEVGRARVGPDSDPVELGPGDYAAYDASGPHVYEALGRRDARATLLVLSTR